MREQRVADPGSWARSFGLRLDDIEALLITHAHTDHTGFARRIADRGICVKAHEREAAFAMDAAAGLQVDSANLPLWRPRAIGFLAAMIRAGAAKGYRLGEVDTVTDGETLDLPGRPKVVATPGHTLGHASYLLEGRRTWMPATRW